MGYKNELLDVLDKIHTTTLGIERIQRNMMMQEDVVVWCKQCIMDIHSVVERNGKNYYVVLDDIRITINGYSFTIITAHKLKK